MATCSIFHYNKTIPREERSLILILKDIQTGVFKEQIEKIRALMSQGKKKEAEALKFKLKSFSTSATFSERRLPEFLKMYNFHVHLDFDYVEPDELDIAIEKATAVIRPFWKTKFPTSIKEVKVTEVVGSTE